MNTVQTDTGNIRAIEPTRTDAMKAAEFKAELVPLLMQISAIIDSAKREGFILSFQIINDQFGRSKADIGIVKPF